MTPRRKTVICAPYREAEQIRDERGLDRRDVVYATETRHLRGLSDFDVIISPRFQPREADFFSFLRYRQAVTKPRENHEAGR
ncbi:hypothetical protein ACQP25_17140 [Microtetraspora malaysiensis]|uniref:hypothetical protein n=1 Tax=Microtetraspora malaysiensis TaxID=161358 RepID=UPI003D8CEBD7